MDHEDIAPGQVLKTFDRDKSKAIERAWLEVFCRNGLGLNAKAYKWHIFSGGGYRACKGGRRCRRTPPTRRRAMAVVDALLGFLASQAGAFGEKA